MRDAAATASTPKTACEALQVISDITATGPAEATTMVVADVFALARTLVRKIGVIYEDDDWDLVSALRAAIDRVDTQVVNDDREPTGAGFDPSAW